MADDSKPYVSAEENLAELTLKALLLGVVVAALLGAANAYLGFKAGQTVSATFPAAVLAIAAFRLPFFRGTVLEQNTMRTAASVGEALAAGAIFTVPAFVMVNVNGQRLWTGFNYWETSLILLVGGLLGILFIILLRRTLTVDAGLPFPESRACSEIVKTGQRGDTGARYVFGAMGLGMLIQVFKDPAGIRLFRESLDFVKEFPASVIHHMDPSRAPLGDVTHKGALVLATPSDLASAHRRGLHHRVRALGHQLRGRRPRLAGVRAARALPQPGPRRAAHEPERPARPAELVFSIWYNQIRPIAVGAMLVGAAKTMFWRCAHSIAQAFRGALPQGQRGREAAHRARPAGARRPAGIAALAVPVTFIYYHFSAQRRSARWSRRGDDGARASCSRRSAATSSASSAARTSRCRASRSRR